MNTAIRVVSLVWGLLCLASVGYAAEERVALMLTGATCPQSYATLEQKFSAIPGIRGIDLHAVPEHALIDVDPTFINSEALAMMTNALLAGQSPCRATVMKSCISADIRSHAGLGATNTNTLSR
ncbi:MAG TPA: hypothetical protein VH681_02455 [Nitrospiraceae bacterium]|jgi:hypothetical protein